MRGRCSTSRRGWRVGKIADQPPLDSARQAAQWQARLLAEPGQRRRSRFARWRADREQHAASHEQIVQTEQLVRSLAGQPEIMALREETLARAHQRSTSGASRWWLGSASLAASLILALCVSLWIAAGPTQPRTMSMAAKADAGERIRTGVGQRAEVELADGSRVMLNTATELRVAFDGQSRRIELLRGQAWFQVARDRARPFVVAAAGREITALGTAFDVRIDRGRLEVMLAEGRVRVTDPARAGVGETGRAIEMVPNQLLIAGPGRVDVRQLADTAPVESWRNGMLIFDNRPLVEAVAEFNRYASRPLRIADQATGQIRISGAFRIGDDRAFTGALAAGFGVKAEPGPDTSAIILRRD